MIPYFNRIWRIIRVTIHKSQKEYVKEYIKKKEIMLWEQKEL